MVTRPALSVAHLHRLKRDELIFNKVMKNIDPDTIAIQAIAYS
jgi:hypothetical protein